MQLNFKKNILITGATGFIGKYLVELLYERGARNIYCLIRNSKKAEALKPYGVNLVYGDITDKNSLKKLFDYKIDIIFHCAACVENKNSKLLHKVNVEGTINICELSMQLGIERMVYLSSVAVISGNKDTPLVEDLPYKATNLYGESKIEAEKEVFKYRARGLRVVILRPCMVYGAGEPHMMKLLIFLLKYRLFPLLNQGRNKFHLVYVKNVVEAMVFSLNDEDFLNGTFFIADKDVLTSYEVFNIMSEAARAPKPVILSHRSQKFLILLPYIGKKLKFFLKDRVYSTKRIESLGFAMPYSSRESLIESTQELVDK